jgi:Fe-S-cluster-containing hydrogenase component 2/CRP-like cAMP-binding protein
VQDLPLTLADLTGHLAGIEGVTPAVVGRLFREDAGPEKRLFFLIQYQPGEYVMARDEYSDYAALHIQGLVRVSAQPRPPVPLPDCWGNPRPWRRRLAALPAVGPLLARLFPVRQTESRLARPGEAGQESSVATRKDMERSHVVLSVRAEDGTVKKPEDRFLGVTSVLLKQRRTQTLLADDDGDQPCRMLLIKHRALMDLLFTGYQKNAPLVPTKFFQTKIHSLLEQTLPDMLSRNRLFRQILHVEDVLRWDGLLSVFVDGVAGLRLPGSLRSLLRQQLQGHALPADAAGLDDAARYHLVSALNRVLTGPDLFLTQSAARNVIDEPARAQWQEQAPASMNQRVLRNRQVLEAALGDTLSPVSKFPLVAPADFRGDFLTVLRDLKVVLVPQRTEKGDVIFQAGQEADALYFILQGKYRVVRPGPGGTLVTNHLEEDGYFGEACALSDAQGQPLKRSAAVEALSRGTLLKLERAAVLKLCERFPAFQERLRREGLRAMRRDRARQSGQRVPPQEPPLEIATRLQVTTNLLVIDMDRCTRCDQCVQACATAHEDRPRFHRANPDLRFGKWEVAGACLHCSDAPCLEDCPVGAITFLETGAVQIHRSRCIGCSKCASACPFGVIDMYEPAAHHPQDRASLPANKTAVATKCDLCLTVDRDPPCVAACPYGAAQRGSPEEFFPGLRGWARLTDPE